MYKDFSCICILLIYSVYNFLPSNYFISMYEISLTINRVLFWPVWSLKIFFFSSWGTPRENLLHVFKLETFFYSHNIDLYSVSCIKPCMQLCFEFLFKFITGIIFQLENTKLEPLLCPSFERSTWIDWIHFI